MEEYRLSSAVRYAMPAMSTTILILPVITVLAGVYEKYLGIDFQSLGVILMIARVLDAISDPIVGFFSDKYHARSGTRKPFILLGGLLSVFCGWFVYMPPDSPSPLYLAFWLSALYLAWTIFEIPHLSWAAEIRHPSDRSADYFGARAISYYIASMTFFVLPLLPFQSSTEFTPQTFVWTLALSGVITIPATIWFVSSTPVNAGVKARLFGAGFRLSCISKSSAKAELIFRRVYCHRRRFPA